VLGSCGRRGHTLAADEIRCGCGDVRRTFGVVAEVCRVLSEPAFVSGVKVVVVVVDNVKVISGTVCAVLGWPYDWWGKQRGGQQRERETDANRAT